MCNAVLREWAASLPWWIYWLMKGYLGGVCGRLKQGVTVETHLGDALHFSSQM